MHPGTVRRRQIFEQDCLYRLYRYIFVYKHNQAYTLYIYNYIYMYIRMDVYQHIDVRPDTWIILRVNDHLLVLVRWLR